MTWQDILKRRLSGRKFRNHVANAIDDMPEWEVTEIVPNKGKNGKIDYTDEPDEPPLFDPRRPPEQPQISPMLNLAEPTPSSQIPIYDFGDDYEIIERDVPSVPVGEELEKKKNWKDEIK